MQKTEVYTWRLTPVTKAALEEAARRQNRSVADLLEEIVTESLSAAGRDSDTEAERQRLLHARAARFAGCISGSDPRRSERARRLVRERLRKHKDRAH